MPTVEEATLPAKMCKPNKGNIDKSHTILPVIKLRLWMEQQRRLLIVDINKNKGYLTALLENNNQIEQDYLKICYEKKDKDARKNILALLMDLNASLLEFGGRGGLISLMDHVPIQNQTLEDLNLMREEGDKQIRAELEFSTKLREIIGTSSSQFRDFDFLDLTPTPETLSYAKRDNEQLK